MRKKLVFAAGVLFCVFIFSETSARRLSKSARSSDGIILQKSDRDLANGAGVALSFLLLAFAINGFQKFIRRRRPSASARRIVEPVEKLQNGVIRRVIIPAK